MIVSKKILSPSNLTQSAVGVSAIRRPLTREGSQAVHTDGVLVHGDTFVSVIHSIQHIRKAVVGV